jgi:hypothetical protein
MHQTNVSRFIILLLVNYLDAGLFRLKRSMMRKIYPRTALGNKLAKHCKGRFV